jgi:hypothetical protein
MAKPIEYVQGGVKVPIGSANVVQMPIRDFAIELHVDPADPRIRDDAYVLLNEDGSVHQRKTIAADAVKEQEKLVIVFSDLSKGAKYTLEIDEGKEGKYYAFYQVPLEDLVAAASQPPAPADDPGDQPLPDSRDSLPPEEEQQEGDFYVAEGKQDAADYTLASGEKPPTDGAEEFVV